MKYFLPVIVGISLIIGLVVLLGYFTSCLWNYALVPQGLKEINLVTGICLNALGTLLFGSGHFTRSIKVSPK